MKLLLSIILPIIFTTHVRTREIEIECEITARHHIHRSCVTSVKECFVDDLIVPDADTHVIFQNAREENFTALLIFSSVLSTLPTEIFYQFPYLVKFDTVSNSVSKIGEKTFQNASQLAEIDLMMNNLTEIEDKAFDGASNLLMLDLSLNLINKISPKAFYGIEKLEYLALFGNKLTVLGRETFQTLPNLKTLELNQNLLKSVDPQVFLKNEKLMVLYLNENQFEDVELEFGDVELNELRLPENPIRKITIKRNAPKTSRNISTIRSIHLDRTSLRSISNIIIDNSIKVSILDLSDNENLSLTSAPVFFNSLSDLYLLNISATDIPDDFLGNIKEVKRLYLSQNHINMRDKMFQQLKSLQVLSLRKMSFQNLDNNWFGGLSNLTKLNLDDNQLSNFSYKSLLLEVLPSLKRLRLQENRFNCSYLKKMGEELTAIGKLTVLGKYYGQLSPKYDDLVHGIPCNNKSDDAFNTTTTHEPPKNDKEGHFWISMGIVMAVVVLAAVVVSYRKILEIYKARRARCLPFSNIEVRKSGLTMPDHSDDCVF